MWRILSEASNPSVDGDMPSPTEFYMFYELSLPREIEYFNWDYEQCAIEFLKVYDQGEMLEIPSNKTMLDMINDNFSVDEIKANIDALKNGKSPGLDHIPAEFVKICKDDLAEIITCALIYIIEKRDFPEVWALGQLTPVFKNGCHKNPNNYRGITILPIFAKIFETAGHICKRCFLNSGQI